MRKLVCIILSFLAWFVSRTHSAFNHIPYVPTFSPEETVNQWKEMERKLVESGESITKLVMPMIIRSSSELDLSPDCQADILKVILALRKFKMWAVKLVDAMGRPGSGLISGSISSHGAYDQCLDLEVPNEFIPGKLQFRGKYCAIDLRPPLPPKPKQIFKGILEPLDNITFKTEFMEYFRNEAYNYYHISMRLGTCAPSTCTNDDIQQIAEYMAWSMGQHATLVHCQVKEDLKVDNVQIGIISVLGVFSCLVALASLVEMFVTQTIPEHYKKSVIWKIVTSFSAISTTRKIFATSPTNDSTLSCLNGVRFFSINWVILCHTYLFLDPVMFRNGLLAHEFAKTPGFQIIGNASLAVDSFFFITSVLMAYHLVQLFDKKGLRAINIPVIFIRRIWRLIPSAMLAVGLTILLPLTGSGPTWTEEVVSMADTCRENWWYIPLFINNFIIPFKACLMTTWYISVDMQLFILGVIFFVIFFRNQKMGWALIAFYIVLSIVTASFVTWYKKLLPAVLVSSPDKEGTQAILRNTYILPHVHLGCYGVGLALGILLARKKTIRIPIILQIVCWPLAIALNGTVVFCTLPWNSGRYPNVLESWTYAGFHRTAWGISMAWITLMCATGKGGLINEILSWRGYAVLNRLTYLVYLLHYLVIAYYLGNLRDVVDVNHPFLVWYFFGNVVASFVAAYVLRVVFEGPLTELEKIFFETLQGRQKSLENGSENQADTNGHLPKAHFNGRDTNGHTNGINGRDTNGHTNGINGKANGDGNGINGKLNGHYRSEKIVVYDSSRL